MANSQPIYHHLLPKTYMKKWCFRGNTIYVIDKQSSELKEKNIENICGLDHFHSIKAGSSFTTPFGRKSIFGFLQDYKIYNDKELIESIELMNENYYNFDKWILYYPNGKLVPKKAKNIIKQQLEMNKYNYIEEEWNSLFENNWSKIISNIFDTLDHIKNGNNVYLDR